MPVFSIACLVVGPGSRSLPAAEASRGGGADARVRCGIGKAYAELVYRLAARAAWEGASVVVFPECSGLPLLGLVPGASKVASSAPSLEDASAMARAWRSRAPSDLFALWRRARSGLTSLPSRPWQESWAST